MFCSVLVPQGPIREDYISDWSTVGHSRAHIPQSAIPSIAQSLPNDVFMDQYIIPYYELVLFWSGWFDMFTSSTSLIHL